MFTVRRPAAYKESSYRISWASLANEPTLLWKHLFHDTLKFFQFNAKQVIWLF